MSNPYDVGNAVYVLARFRDVTMKRTDPDSMSITIFDSNGTEKVTEAGMTRLIKGEYFYIYQSAEGDAVGDYRAKVKATKGAFNSVADQVVFSLE